MDKIIPVFDDVQRSYQLHKKLDQKLRAMVTKGQIKSSEELFKGIFHCLRHTLLVFEKEPAVERVINFAVSFAATYNAPAEGEFDGIGFLLRQLLAVHDAANKSVRFRVCQIVAKLLKAFGTEATIYDDLWDEIQLTMMKRARDKFPAVRAQAVCALQRLQDPSDPQCPVMALISQLAECDSSPDVRKAALEQLPIQSVETKCLVIGRTQDVKENVRKEAYVVLGDEIPNMKQYTIAERVQLLKDGLNDRAESVRLACRSRLLLPWLESVGGSVRELLVRLDVENLDGVVGETILRNIFEATTVDRLLANFEGIVEKKEEEEGGCRIVIELSKLDSENALYWRCLCEHLKKAEGERFLDSVLPEASVVCSFIERFAAEHVTSDVIRAPELALSVEFVLRELLKIALTFDMSDEVGRSNLKHLVHLLLCNPVLPLGVIPFACQCLLKASSDENEYLETALGVISEIQTSLDDTEQVSSSQDAFATMSQPSKDNAESLMKILTVCCETLKQLSHIQFSASLQALCDFLILPAFQAEEELIRTQAITALGLLAVVSPQLAQRHMVLFLQAAQVDGENARFASLCVVFDLLLVYGMDHFQMADNEESDHHISGDNSGSLADESNPDSSAVILTLLSNFLEDENSDIRSITAEGIAKLLLSGRLVSSKFLSHLLLLWYNPTSGDMPQMRCCLGAFFPRFAFKSVENQRAIAEIFIPTLNILIDSPETSPLSAVNFSNVAEFMIHLTNACFLKEKEKNMDDSQSENVHVKLASDICQSIVVNSGDNGRFWCRCLNLLDIPRTASSEVLETLCGLLDEMMECVKDKMSLKFITKFRVSLLGAAAAACPPGNAGGALPDGEIAERSDGENSQSGMMKSAQKKRQRGLTLLQTPATHPTKYKKSTKKHTKSSKASTCSQSLCTSDLSDDGSNGIEWDPSSDL